VGLVIVRVAADVQVADAGRVMHHEPVRRVLLHPAVGGGEPAALPAIVEVDAPRFIDDGRDDDTGMTGIPVSSSRPSSMNRGASTSTMAGSAAGSPPPTAG